MALKIASGGCSTAFLARDLPQKSRLCSSPLNVNLPRRRKPIAVATLAFQPVPKPSKIPPARVESLSTFAGQSMNDRDQLSPQKLEDWMRESIGEIVRNIGKAPFLVHIFSEEEGNTRKVSGTALPKMSPPSSQLVLEREAVTTADSWPAIKNRWQRESSVPDGIILVEELGSGEDGGVVVEEDEECRCEKRWGVVIQGRGLNTSACYILDTCRVPSAVGFCTHFCLVKAQCFGEPAELQMKKAWLQRGEDRYGG
ncbi:hypothetical protein HPP92_012354 [Vanilla planifolia]|uniref:DUF7804 domain-containing protein n=1 Tax=Vanilla planifolia TaxID=51239 RepID=A0A835UU69_VANPL|nr:hypothetical protein HPP92_012755 [Vanilla planifolia]KAG0477635.1 hypothetical protein HPP92_012354 [Vanilla planifolia]